MIPVPGRLLLGSGGVWELCSPHSTPPGQLGRSVTLSSANTKLVMLSRVEMRRLGGHLRTSLRDGLLIPGARQPLGGSDAVDLPLRALPLLLVAHTTVAVLVDTVAVPEKAAGESNVSLREDTTLARYHRSHEGVESRESRGADCG